MNLRERFNAGLVTLRNSVTNTFSKFVPNLTYFGTNPNSIIVNKLDVRPIVRTNSDIQRWRMALVTAEGIGQQRQILFDIYSEILLDGYLSEGLLGKRLKSIQNKHLIFQNADGTVNEELNALTLTSFFADLLQHVIESKFWGHSLIELSWSKDGKSETILIPRKHVKPRYKIVTQNQWDTEGYRYDEEPFTRTVISVGDEEDLGILNKVAPLVLWKRADMGDWAEFAEVFGMPTVFAKYNNEQSRQMLIDALDAMGSRGRAVMPNDATIEFHEAANAGKGGGDVFNTFRTSLNEEMAITVLGNTMTTSEAKHSGYAQSKTHQDSQNELHKDDCMFVMRVLNEKVIPVLKNLGYNVTAGSFKFVEDEAISLTDRLAIDMQVSTKVPIGNSYWYDKYNIPKPTDAEIAEQEANEADDDETDPNDALDDAKQEAADSNSNLTGSAKPDRLRKKKVPN